MMKDKLYPGESMKHNSEVPASELTKKNMFKKMNYTHFSANVVKVRRKGASLVHDPKVN